MGYGVSIHAPVVGATYICRISGQPAQFRSTRPWWARHTEARTPAQIILFRSTRPWWARPSHSGVPCSSSLFRSTRPWWARQIPVRGFGLSRRFRSTRPWWARRGRSGKGDGARRVSIHAPVVGATYFTNGLVSRILVSIHAPVVGATHHGSRAKRRHACFDPRARGGRDVDPCTTIAD